MVRIATRTHPPSLSNNFFGRLWLVAWGHLDKLAKHLSVGAREARTSPLYLWSAVGLVLLSSIPSFIALGYAAIEGSDSGKALLYYKICPPLRYITATCTLAATFFDLGEKQTKVHFRYVSERVKRGAKIIRLCCS